MMASLEFEASSLLASLEPLLGLSLSQNSGCLGFSNFSLGVFPSWFLVASDPLRLGLLVCWWLGRNLFEFGKHVVLWVF